MKYAIALAALATASIAHAQPTVQERPSPVTVVVNMGPFDSANNLWTAYVHVQALSVCPGVSYDTVIQISGTKDADDARNKAKPGIDKIKADVQKEMNNCHR